MGVPVKASLNRVVISKCADLHMCVCVCVTAHVNALKLVERAKCLQLHHVHNYSQLISEHCTFFFLVWYRCLRETEKVSVSVMAKLLKFKALEVDLIYSP